jgi:hypothetical protein
MPRGTAQTIEILSPFPDFSRACDTENFPPLDSASAARAVPPFFKEGAQASARALKAVAFSGELSASVCGEIASFPKGRGD